MDSATITAWAAMATAIAACVGPALTAHIHAKADVTIKKMELFHARYDAALHSFIKNYSELGALSSNIFEFKCSALELASCVESCELRLDITDLVRIVSDSNFEATAESDAKLSEILDKLTQSL